MIPRLKRREMSAMDAMSNALVAAGVRTDVNIWYCLAEVPDGDARDLPGRYLSQEETNHRDRFHFRADRNAFTIAHDLLRRSLSRYAAIAPADWRFGANEHGKPTIANADPKARSLSFNLSYTRGCAACAIASGGHIGVDVESTEQPENVQEVAERYFSRNEIDWIRSGSKVSRNNRFTELWTLKEAFLKAVGVGLSGSLKQISFQIDEHSCVKVFAPSVVDADEWHFGLFEPLESVRLAVAVRGVETPRFIIRRDSLL
jgi:4'-phosphopantetheinyl transferase